MKRPSFLLFACLFSLLLSAAHCKKDRFELPPETTTGANTFGCKVNGKVFVPRDGKGKPGLFCQYVNLGSGEGGGWFLNIPATDWKGKGYPSMGITTDSLFIEEGGTYPFKRRTKGYANAEYDFGSKNYIIIPPDSGELIITKHDPLRRILSGRFWFDGTDKESGEKVEIREGRFDIVY
ncbi:MAG: hypothetical protein QM763_16725 [Agriterribacter sp.]